MVAVPDNAVETASLSAFRLIDILKLNFHFSDVDAALVHDFGATANYFAIRR